MAERPVVAIISNALTPYRLHLHRRIVREMPEIELASLFTHGQSNAPWADRPPVDINPVEFGSGELASDQSRMRYAFHEWRKGGRIIRWLREHQARAVVVLGYNDLGRVRVIRWCRNHGLPRFLFGDSNIRGDRGRGIKRRLKFAFVSRVGAWTSGVLVCGSLGREYFVRYGVSPNRIWPFPYEPDYDQITNRSTADVAAIRQRFQISADRRYLLYCGRLSPEKRVDLLLDSFAELAADHSNWDIVIAGDGPLRAELQKQVPANLTRRVYWLGFLDDQAAISALYRVASVFVLPSDYEPWAVVINEAAAAGLAIVASDMVGAAADLVRDGVNGRIFANGNRNSLTECLRDLLAGDHATEFGGKSLETLAEWRRSSDPIEGLRKALQSAGVGALTPV